MAYEKQTWATGDTITAAKLNNMEDGIGNSFSPFIVNVTYNDSDESYSADKTYSQVLEALNNGMFVLYLIIAGDGCSLSLTVENSENKILISTCLGIGANDVLTGTVYIHDSNGFTPDE